MGLTCVAIPIIISTSLNIKPTQLLVFKMGNYITLDIEIQAIKDFLTKTLEAVDVESKTICEQEKAGQFTGIDDFSNALFFPLEREAIAIRAVFYELNALVEWELQNVAGVAYQYSTKFKHPKSFTDISSLDEVSRVKLVYDLQFGKICELIEDYYKINLSQLPSFEQFQFVRQSINAYKHRKGFKDFRRDKDAELIEQFRLNREDAYQAIESSRAFLRAFWQAVGR